MRHELLWYRETYWSISSNTIINIKIIKKKQGQDVVLFLAKKLAAGTKANVHSSI